MVDDDRSLRQGLARIISSAGWNVETFASARAFLERAGHAGTGCVTMDVGMPEMTGPELQREMLARGISLPVIFISGYGDVPTEVPAADFLVKPVDEEALLQAIQRVLERHGTKVQLAR